jgi:hypothetical protein
MYQNNIETKFKIWDIVIRKWAKDFKGNTIKKWKKINLIEIRLTQNEFQNTIFYWFENTLNKYHENILNLE